MTTDRETLQQIQEIVQAALKRPPDCQAEPNLLDVPYRSQLGPGADKFNNDCGAASGAMLVDAYTDNHISVTDFYEMTGATGDQYLNATQMIRVLDKLGVSARWNELLGLPELFIYLMNKRPPIVLINYAVIQEAIDTESKFKGPHFAVVVGMDIQYVFLHDPLWSGAGGKGLAVPMETFKKAWEATPGNSVSFAAIVPNLPLGNYQPEGFRVRVTAYVLNVRKGPGTNYPKNGNGLTMGQEVIVTETQEVAGDTWGRIGPEHWIHLGYAEKV